MTPCPVSIASDTTNATTSHTLPLPDMDVPAQLDRAPGKWCGTHSFSKDVFHKGHPIALEGHDVGPLITHLLLTPLVELKSSRKMAFTASTVVLNKKPGACTKPLTPMLACGDISLPAGSNISNGTHSVFLGMSDFDIGLGWYDIGVAVIVDTVSLVLGAKEMGENLTKRTPEEPGTEELLSDGFGLDGTKALLGAPFSLGRSVLVSWHNDWKTPIGTKIGVGGGAASGSREWSYDPVKKTFTVKDTLIGPGGSFEDSAEYGSGKVKSTTTAKTPLAGGQEKTWGPPL